MKKLFLIICFLGLAAFLRAQEEQITVQVVKRVSQLPSSPLAYMDNPMQYFTVTITNIGEPVDVYLTCEFRLNGHRIIYSRDTNTVIPAMTLPNGITMLDNSIYDSQFGGRMEFDMTYFNELYGGDPMSQIANLTRLPEGDYEFFLRVHPYVDATTPTAPYAGSAAEGFEIVYSGTAPELITPLSEQVNWGANARADSRDRTKKSTTKTTKNESDFGLLTSMGRTSSNRNSLTPQRKLTFRWTPVITSSDANPQFNYTLKIVAVMPNQNAQDAIDHNPVVVSTSTRNTYCIIDTLQDMKYQFEQGSTYAVQVLAEMVAKSARGGAMSELEVIEVANGGKSQVVTFSWGKAKYSISYNEIKAPLDTAWVELRYHDNIQQLLRETRLHQIVSPADVVSPDTFDIAFSRPGWTQVTGPSSINGVEYTAHVYNYLGENECTLHQQPITKASQMIPGQYYYLDVEAVINYHYSWDSVRATVHYINGIEADTEADTVKGECDGSVTRHVGKVFLYGTRADRPYVTKYETPSVGLRLTADYMSDSSCIHLNWYHHYKSKAGDKSSRDKKSSKGLFHTVVYRSIDGGPFVGIASLSSDQESYIDRDIQRGQTVRYFVKLHLTQYKQSKPSNTSKVTVR